MSKKDLFTQEEAILLVKALAKAHEQIAQLEEQLEDANESKDQYRDYWLEETEKTKALESEVEMLKANIESNEAAKDLPSAE